MSLSSSHSLILCSLFHSFPSDCRTKFSFYVFSRSEAHDRTTTISAPVIGTLQKLPPVGALDAMEVHRQHVSMTTAHGHYTPPLATNRLTRQSDLSWMDPEGHDLRGHHHDLHPAQKKHLMKNQGQPSQSRRNTQTVFRMTKADRAKSRGYIAPSSSISGSSGLSRSAGSQAGTLMVDNGKLVMVQNQGVVNPAFVREDCTAVLF